MPTSYRRRRRWLAALLLAAAAPWPAALAQAWLPPQGELDLSLNYNYVLNRNHYTSTGDQLDVGHTRTHTTTLGVAWSPDERWMLAVSLPWVRTQFHGPGHHGPEVDTGHANDFVTDLRLELHWQASLRPIALAPYVAVIAPVSHYPTLGHAAPGRGLDELWLGAWTGRSFDAWLPGTYLQARYNRAFVERVAGIRHDHSNADVELGWFVAPRWSLQATASWRWAHGGIDLPVPATDPLFPYHDQLGATEYFNLTGGVNWFPSDRLGLYANYTRSQHGRNAHKIDRGLSLGIGYSLAGR